MPHEDQYEWPSFETVLRDVAPDSPTARSLESEDQRARESFLEETVGPLEPWTEEIAADPAILQTETPAHSAPAREDLADHESAGEFVAADLPDPLVPLEIDTSSIRALLEPVDSETLTSDHPALQELEPEPILDFEPIEPEREAEPEPVATFEETEAEPVATFEEIEAEPVDSEPEAVTVFEEIEAEPEPMPEFEAIAEAPSDSNVLEFSTDDFATPIGETSEDLFSSDPFVGEDVFTAEPSLVFELDESEISDVDAAHDEDSNYQGQPLENPFEDAAQLSTEDSPSVEPAMNWDEDSSFVDASEPAEVSFIELPTAEPEAVVFEDLAPESSWADLGEPIHHQGMARPDRDSEPETSTFDGEIEEIESSDVNPFEAVELDAFDLNDESPAIEAERIDLHGEDLYSSNIEADFDSIAAADEIETDLSELLGDFEISNDAEDSNVIPLHPVVDELDTDAAASPEAPSRSATGSTPAPRATEWASLAPPDPADAPDPWAHMRPQEETKSGFWANRPRFFGGDERRQRRSKRSEKSQSEIDEGVNISFDKTCPNCSAECHVDLDDPVGRRVHVSCPDCLHVWHTPYIFEDTQTG